MKILPCALICLLSAGDSAFAQQEAAPPTASQQQAATPAAPPATTPQATVAAPPQATVAAAPPAPPTPNTLMDGTAVKLRLAENLTSATAKAGQQVSFETTEDVVIEGVTVIPKGTQALATVTDAVPKRSMGRGGKLDVNVDSTRLVDGEKVQLRAVQDAKGGGHTGAMTGAMVATAIVFFPAAPLFLFIHGKDITIPEGTPVTAFVQGDMHLDMAKMQPAPTIDSPRVGLPSATDTASLTIQSSVLGADIEVDGAFVGSTPSTITVSPGQHTIAIKKKGYADWSKTMNVSGSGVHLSADLIAN